ncbi:carboxypeptidase M32 [Mesorhizobium erdmanii]|uniref:Metal-dependent carboxypeptidase n=1 Tax=Mesorhizobium erdmanii TaxID=1777866 RepID=A0A6M7UJC9_9HYPH|nr:MULTISPECIES: carboxypeptidase M32 [Mesorhizobium]OBQ69952.1 carboxypeptidase [Mesorhizobium loti]QKC76260.1 carboxypeptidase M32 [Mesorhizobium erdmanii]
MSYAAFEAEVAKVNDILCAVNVLVWDSRTMMPSAAAEARGKQLGTLATVAREIATGDTMRKALDAARMELMGMPGEHLRRHALDDAASAIATLSRIPARLVQEAAQRRTEGQAVWIKARAGNDFAAFAPVLERTVELQREISEHVGYVDHPYDAACGTFEPDVTWPRLKDLYAELKSTIGPLLQAALQARPARVDILERTYPIEKQKAFSKTVATTMGYDFERGRLDDTVHPFEISFTRADARITGRFRENWLPGGLFAVWHEAGHGIYEQGISPEFTRSVFTTDLVNLYAVGGTSFGMHESQSRLWENRVGRSRRFWEQNFGTLRAEFPDQLADVSVADFWRAVNAPRPSLIRVEADELTYDLHIILRSEIEAGLMDGSLRVPDLPAIWADKVRSYLGLDVPTDTLGVLQDVHWSAGMIGSFPTYTMGNIMSSQLFKAATKMPEVERGLETGDCAPLRTWLTDKVHRHGRSLTPAEILKAATGKVLGIDDYIDDLRRKVTELHA